MAATLKDALEAGFTKHVQFDSLDYTLDVMVCRNDDLGDRIMVWDLEENEWLWVNGWLFDNEVLEDQEGDIEASFMAALNAEFGL